MTAVLLSIAQLETGRTVGMALICPEARYASVMWHGAPRIDRRMASPAIWRAVIAELTPGLDAGPLARESAIVRLIADDASPFAIQCVWSRPLEEVAPASTAAQLDHILTAAAR